MLRPLHPGHFVKKIKDHEYSILLQRSGIHIPIGIKGKEQLIFPRTQALYAVCEGRLTNREKEVAYEWLENKNVPEIADVYGMSQSTVRTFIKKVYAKTNVHHKGALLKKFS